jgi:hypothetical protein
MFPTSPENCRHTTLKRTKKPILSHFSMNFDQITAVAYSAKSLVNKRLLGLFVTKHNTKITGKKKIKPCISHLNLG